MKKFENINKLYSKNKRKIIEIKDSIKIIKNRNKIHYFVSDIAISTLTL